MRLHPEQHPSFKGGTIEKSCATCSNTFFVHRGRKESAKFCSVRCNLPTPESIAKGVATRLEGMASGRISRGGNKKGFVPKPEAIEKQRQKMKGRMPKNIEIFKASRWPQGAKSTPDCIDCGKKKTTHSGLRCRSCAQAGDKNCAWQGGITEINRIVRSSLKYKKWRKQVLERDQYTCQGCGAIGTDMDVDHIYPLSTLIKDHGVTTLPQAYKSKEFWDIDNGRTLCKPCHDKTETSQRLYFKKKAL